MSTFCTMLPSRIAISSGAYSAGTWSAVSGFQALDLSLDALSTVPAGATTAIFHVNTNSTGARFGVQDANGADLFTVSDSAVTGRQDFAMFIPINGTKTVDVFVTNTTNAVIYLMGYMSHPTHITPVGVAGSITSATTTTIDLGTTNIVPSGAANGSVIVTVDKQCKMAGATADLASMLRPGNNVVGAYAVVPLDAARKFYVTSYATFGGASALKVIAWMAPGAYVPETSYTSEDVTTGVGTAFAQLTKTSNGAYDHWRINSGTTTTGGSGNVIRGLRPAGDTSYTIAIDGDTTVNSPYAFVKPSATGLVDGYATVASAAHYERHGTFVADTAAANISGIDTFVAGATATVTFSKAVTSVTRLRVASAVGLDLHYIDITSFSGGGTTWTFIVPSPTNNTDGIRLGAVTISPTTNTGTGADFTGLSYSKSGFSSVNMEDIIANNVCQGDTPALITDDQLASAYNRIDKHGAYQYPSPVTPYTETIYRYSVTDFKWYTFTLTVSSAAATDLDPDADTFGSVSGRPLSTATPAAKTITLAGMTPATDSLAVATGGLRYRVSTDGGATFGAMTSASTNVRNGYVLDAELDSSGTYSTLKTGTLTVGTTAFNLAVTTMAEPNVAPTINSVVMGGVTAQINATDANVGDTLSYSVTTAAAYGTATVNSSTGLVTYTPNGSFVSSDTFKVTVSDGHGGISSVTFVVKAGALTSTGGNAFSKSLTLKSTIVRGM